LKSLLNIYIILITIFMITGISYSEEDKIAPDFSLKDMENSKISLSETLKNSDAVMLVFWSYCCSKDDIPIINDLYSNFKNKGLEVLTISLDKGSNITKIKSYMKYKKYDFKLLFDKDGKVYRKYGGRMTKPVVIIINNEGNIVFKHQGHSTYAFYEKEIKSVLK